MAEPKRDYQTPQRLDVRERRGNLTDVLGQARNGHAFLITWHDKVLAELRPPPKIDSAQRGPGALRGRIRMASDFDTLPPDVLAAMEGEGA